MFTSKKCKIRIKKKQLQFATTIRRLYSGTWTLLMHFYLLLLLKRFWCRWKSPDNKANYFIQFCFIVTIISILIGTQCLATLFYFFLLLYIYRSSTHSSVLHFIVMPQFFFVVQINNNKKNCKSSMELQR